MTIRSRLKLLYPLAEKLLTPPPPNDIGNRDIEYSFMAENIPRIETVKAHALDIGSGHSWLGLFPARLGYETLVIDIRDIFWPFKHSNFSFQKKDILSLPIQGSPQFDLILFCSTIEHIGLKRYGNKQSLEDGDIRAMEVIRSVLSPEGTLLFTTSIGVNKVVPGLHRIYGRERMNRLLEGLKTVKEEYWTKNNTNCWVEGTPEEAYKVEGNDHYYALALFVLRKI